MASSQRWAEVQFVPGRQVGYEELGRMMKWRLSKTSDPNTYLCIPKEYYDRSSRPDITGFEVVCRTGQTDLARRIEAHFSQSPVASNVIDADEVEVELLKLLRAQRPNNPLRAVSLALTGLPVKHLAQYLPKIIETLGLAGNTGYLIFLKVDRCFFIRNAWLRFLAAYAQEPQLFMRSTLGPDGRPDPQSFKGIEGAENLYRSKNFEAGGYFALPLLLCSPASLGIMGFRKNGLYLWLEENPFQSAVVDDYGNGQLSLDWLPLNENPLDLVRESGYLGDHDEIAWDWAKLPPFALDLVEWFTERMDYLFSYMANPCYFVDQNSKHQPVRHFLTQLSIHRLFVIAESILHLHSRAHYERISLLFDGLDTLAGLRQGDFDQTLSIQVIERRLKDVLDAVPDSVRALFKARFDRLPAALKQVKSGFLEPSRNREPHELIRQIRNSKHSFVGTGQRGAGDFSLIFEHSCALPPELAEIVVLHLLWLVSDPERLRFHYPHKTRAK